MRAADAGKLRRTPIGGIQFMRPLVGGPSRGRAEGLQHEVDG